MRINEASSAGALSQALLRDAHDASPAHLFPRKIGTSIDSRAYSHQNSHAVATREAAEPGA
jgi:hypothetical protein